MAAVAAGRVSSFRFMAVSTTGSVGGVMVRQFPFVYDIICGAGTNGTLMAIDACL
ncbi:MAG: hypothetical protein HY888_00240 [Deltaproteobacteria bacterium]|nr:hypothetical protein [Deltaproteobacteria bacterium]